MTPLFYEESANRTLYIVDGGPEKTLQTDAVMTAHAMREKPLCHPCLIIEISQVSSTREHKASLNQYVKNQKN